MDCTMEVLHTQLLPSPPIVPSMVNGGGGGVGGGIGWKPPGGVGGGDGHSATAGAEAMLATVTETPVTAESMLVAAAGDAVFVASCDDTHTRRMARLVVRREQERGMEKKALIRAGECDHVSWRMHPC